MTRIVTIWYAYGGTPDYSRDVTSHKELWEGNGNSHSHNSDTVMGMGREQGIFVWKKDLIKRKKKRNSYVLTAHCADPQSSRNPWPVH